MQPHPPIIFFAVQYVLYPHTGNFANNSPGFQEQIRYNDPCCLLRFATDSHPIMTQWSTETTDILARPIRTYLYVNGVAISKYDNHGVQFDMEDGGNRQ